MEEANDVPQPGSSTIHWTESNRGVPGASTNTVAVDQGGKIKLTAGQNGTHVIGDELGFVP